MSRLDYSKWDHIEVSDDEDDTHPNIDTPSLFRWRHQARIDRMDEAKKEKETFDQGYDQHQRKMNELKQKIKKAEADAASEELAKLKLEASDLEKQEEDYRKKEDDLKKKERLTPWNIDTICKDGKSKTIINKYEPPPPEPKSEEEMFERQQSFTDKNEKQIKKFGMTRRYEDSQDFLDENKHLVCEETANYLVLWCINLEVEEKHDLMAHIAHQTIIMQFILELAKSLKTDPRNCIKAFFSRIKLAEKQYMDAFTDELEAFKDRVRTRAKARIEEAVKQVEEEERQKRLGPGGLDPQEVFESLPEKLQKCFELRDTAMLEKELTTMPKPEAEDILKRCIDSGLWVPNAADEAAKKASSSPEDVD